MATENASTASDEKYVDLSGIPASAGSWKNPYEPLIQACANDPEEVQARYETHRQSRNKQQREKLLDPKFKGADVDPILYKLLHRREYPDFHDPRYCLVFWARPTEPLKKLIQIVQQKLKKVLPNLWLMPPDNLHMTAMEIAHSRTQEEIDQLLTKLEPNLAEITDYTYDHRARLVRPLLGFDASAFALSFVPTIRSRQDHGDAVYTYHHLRRDLHDLCKNCGVDVGSRYVVPSAHLTIGRFVTQADICGENEATTPDPAKVKILLATIEEINAWLQKKYWHEDGKVRWDGSEWVVGQTRGLDCGKGTLWYGDAERIRLGKGF